MRRLLTTVTVLAVAAGGAPATASELPAPLPAGRLAFSTGVYQSDDQQSSHFVDGLGTMNLDGSDKRTLTAPPGPAHDHSPDWSPDGRWLAAMRQLDQPDSPTSTEIRVTSADGSSSQVVGHGTFPTWSPDGRTLAWSSKDPDRPGLVLLPVDTTGPDLVTRPSGLRELATPRRALASAWDPLGGSLAVWVDQVGTPQQRDLFHVEVATGAVRQLAPGIYQDHASVRPAWHPAGLQLAVLAAQGAERPGATQAWLVAADGSRSARLLPDADPQEQHHWVTWAPSGLALAVETNNSVLLVSAAGAVLRELGPGRLQQPQTPVWSPDGTHVYVVADEGGGEWKPELWALPVVGDDVRQLTTDSSVFPTTATAVDPGLVLRIIGTSPADTAVVVADRLPDSSTVVVATAASAAAATPLATELRAPLLETGPDGVPEETRRALQDSHPTTAWVVGQVTDAVEAQLRELGVTTVHRVGGSDEPAVAAAVAEHLPARTAFLAPAEGPVEQAASAAVAGARGQPLLLTGSRSLGASTRAALQGAGVTAVHLTAASSAVAPSVEEELRSLGITVDRLAGDSPAAAALRLAEAFAAGSSLAGPVVVPASSPGIGGPVLAARRGTVLLPAGTGAADPVVAFVDAHHEAIAHVDMVAGPAALPPGLETAVERAVQDGPRAEQPPAPQQPAPGEPAPGDPSPQQPEPAEPAPDDPSPQQPAPQQPSPADPAPDPAPGATGPRSTDSACPSRVPEDGFLDVPADNAHERAVDCLLWWGVARGRTSTEYAPVATVTRGQMASFMAQLVLRSGGQLPAAGPDVFDDDDGSPHEEAVNRLARAGIVSGRTDGSYGPDLPVTRDAMAKFLVLSVEHRTGRRLPPSPDRFGDDDGNTHEQNIDRAAAAGLTGGTTPSTYAPRLPVRRDQMASFLARSLALLVDESVTAPPA